MTEYLVIVNPASGRGRGQQRAEALCGRLPGSCRVEIVETTHRGSAAELAATRRDEVERVIAIGGDGTLNEVLSGLLSTGRASEELPELGFLPAGTGNAAVRAFGFSADPLAVASALPGADSRPVDVGVVTYEGGERPFLLWFGAGVDGVVIHTLNTSRAGFMGVSGLLGNMPRVLGAVFRYAMPLIEGEVDGSTLGPSSSVIVTNVAELAFRGVLARTADPFDGRLDVVSAPPGSVLTICRLAASMVATSLTRARGVRHALASEVSLTSDGIVPFQIDGEPVGTLPAAVSVRPGAIRLLLT